MSVASRGEERGEGEQGREYFQGEESFEGEKREMMREKRTGKGEERAEKRGAVHRH